MLADRPLAAGGSNQTAIAGIQASLDALNAQRTATQIAGVTMIAQATHQSEATTTARPDAKGTAYAYMTATAQQALSEASAPAGWRLVFFDPFVSNAKNWPHGVSNSQWAFIDRQVSDGVYEWKLRAKQGFFHFGYPEIMTSLDDFYAFVDARLESGEPGASYGLVVRQIGGNFYAFQVNEQGYWDISLRLNDHWSPVKSGRSEQIVTSGNHLAVKGISPSTSTISR